MPFYRLIISALLLSNVVVMPYLCLGVDKKEPLPPAPKRNNNSAASSSVRISGKKMEILPRESTQVFSGDVLVEHSSFSMKADKVVSRRSNAIVEAYGDVRIVSIDDVSGSQCLAPSKKISGDEAIYFSQASTGSVKGSPAVIEFEDDKKASNRLESRLINFSTVSVLAEGSSTTLTRNEFEHDMFLRVLTSQKMRYVRDINAGEKFFASPVEEIFVDDSKKNKYKARFSASELLYDVTAGKVYLIGDVSGRINFTGERR